MRISHVNLFLAVLLALTSFFLEANAQTNVINNHYDGPYIFYRDSVMKIFTFVQDSTKKVNYNEQTFNLKDTSYVLNQLKSSFGFEFNPYNQYSYDTCVVNARRICVISDVHGRYNNMIAQLRYNKIIDDKLNWNFDDGHLVVLGDIISKGPNVTECLWLIKKLEIQAQKAKGKVHFLLGNHEAFLLKGVYSDLDPKYRIVCKKLGVLYNQLYGNDTEFGKWIKTRNTIMKINNILFVHGGISEKMLNKNLSMSKINKLTRTVFSNEHLLFLDPNEKENCEFMFGFCGPLLYRGYIIKKDNPCEKDSISNKEISAILKTYNCSHIIVGHTEVNKIVPLFDNMVIPVNTFFPFDDKLITPSNAQMLLIENNDFYILYEDRAKEKIIFHNN